MSESVRIQLQVCADMATGKVSGFTQLHEDLERAINVSGKSKSTLSNYSRHHTHLELHSNQQPTELDQEQVLDYLLLIKANGTPNIANSCQSSH